MLNKKLYLTAGVLLGLPALAWAAKVTSIDFQAGANSSEIDIRADGPISFDKQENADDKQIVLDLKGASLSKNASRNLDTSSFDSKVLLVSPYSVDGQPDNSRVVIQLKDMQNVDVSQNGNTLKISVPNSGTYTPTQAAMNDSPSESAGAGSASPQMAPTSGTSAANSEDVAPDITRQSKNSDIQVGSMTTTPGGKAERQSAVGMKDKLDQFVDARETKRFVGHPITLKVRDAELTDVFRLIAEASGFNIVLSDNIKGKITLSLENVPWDQALDVILHTNKLGAERNNNLLRVVPLTDLTAEKTEELAAKLATDASAPRVTRIFPISYAKLDDLTNILLKFSGSASQATSAAANGGTASGQGASTLVQADSRTNSIVIRDIPENIARDQKLISLLDTQTPQVLIESKIVEATEGFQNSLNGSLGFGKQTGQGQYFSSFNGSNPVDPLFSLGGNSVYPQGGVQASGVANGTTPGGNIGISPQFAFLPGNLRLNALLQLTESDSNVRVISSPRTVVLDKEQANIVQSTPVLVPATTSTQNGPVSTVTIAQANLSLNVTPTVTNEGSVIMQLNVSNDVPFNLPNSTQQAVANRNITTRVLVESGSTLVMGGIYTVSTSQSSSGFPFLRSIPIIGALFGQENDSNTRSELFFFITPRILNLKETGLSG
jgi:type IV pilus assembly protein PilQ